MVAAVHLERRDRIINYYTSNERPAFQQGVIAFKQKIN